MKADDGAALAGARRAAAGAGERGVALLLALLTMVLLTVVVIEFTVSTQVDYRRAAMWVAGRRAALVADGGVILAMEVLRQDATFGDTDALTDIWAREMPPIDTGAGMLSVRIEDEQGKLNLNGLASGALSPAGRRLQTLLQYLTLDPGLASPLADWLDRNRDTGPGALAAEAEWYARATPPYAPRNGPMASYAELALVRGFTPAVLSRLRPFVTVLPETDSRVNANTAPPEVLRVLDPRLDDEFLVRRLVEARTVSPFTKPAEMAALTGMESFSADELGRLFTFASRWFRIRATGDVGGAMRSAEALVERDYGVSKIVYLLPRRGPNIVGLDSGIRTRIDDAGLLGGTRR
ncbi:MAG: type II secretion system minor pseudopilin GspK [Candidatus Binatia bacterium]